MAARKPLHPRPDQQRCRAGLPGPAPPRSV